MRLISQNGKVDVPYDITHLYVMGFDYNYQIVAYTNNDDNTMGNYSTKEKALEVMEMLQNQYKRFMATALMDIKKENIYFRFPADEDVEDVNK